MGGQERNVPKRGDRNMILNKYNNAKKAQDDHRKRYRSDGIAKNRGTPASPDFVRVSTMHKYVLQGWGNKLSKKRLDVLDVGCNGGTLSVPLLPYCNLSGVDIVQELVQKARRRGIFAMEAPAEKLPFEPKTYDVVMCGEVLEHLYDPIPAIKEAKRVLKVGGFYVFSVPHEKAISPDGDYHNHVFNSVELSGMIMKVFNKECLLIEVPYTKMYCRANKISETWPQWYVGVVQK